MYVHVENFVLFPFFVCLDLTWCFKVWNEERGGGWCGTGLYSLTGTPEAVLFGLSLCVLAFFYRCVQVCPDQRLLSDWPRVHSLRTEDRSFLWFISKSWLQSHWAAVTEEQTNEVGLFCCVLQRPLTDTSNCSSSGDALSAFTYMLLDNLFETDVSDGVPVVLANRLTAGLQREGVMKGLVSG